MKDGSVEGRIVHVPECGQQLKMDVVEFPYPPAGHVRLRVAACGICHTDAHLIAGLVPGMSFPFVPGHEVTGTIDALGDGVTGWMLGQRVGVGWHGGHCRVCRECRRGDFVLCAAPQVPGLTYPGGYADYMIVPAEALAAVPDELSSPLAAPLFCAGVTAFNALKNSNAEPGDLIAVHGLGGLGHLGVQFAVKLGFRTAAIARGRRKSAAAHTLGAHYYIDSESQDVVKALQDLGGAKLILTTATNSGAIAAIVGGLGHRGTLAIAGISTEPVSVKSLQLIMRRQSIVGCACGTVADSEDAVRFAALSGVRPVVECFPLERAPEAFNRMLSGEALFRVVMETGV